MITSTIVLAMVMGLGGLISIMMRQQVESSNGSDKNCDPSYTDVCIAPPPPDLNCDDVPDKDIKGEGGDLHGFDREGDGIGCVSL